ncbi:uncharacterized protein TNIN_137181 [Trichonephila inaurata madagascariensis]|uniref:Uncharacterized protein n=1 Tax=Trichonephila inaurata madagascariensis TaxID=2747483 RepID=A0A8X6Y6P5_9ARAC|nr:uncharacterized protein TNIN_137181 [Trichonephila inaurata madagascariensis]
MSLTLKVSTFAVLVAWLMILLSTTPGKIDAGPNSNISVCFFCDENDFSVRNLLCCTLTSRCCGPDRI